MANSLREFLEEPSQQTTQTIPKPKTKPKTSSLREFLEEPAQQTTVQDQLAEQTTETPAMFQEAPEPVQQKPQSLKEFLESSDDTTAQATGQERELDATDVQSLISTKPGHPLKVPVFKPEIAPSDREPQKKSTFGRIKQGFSDLISGRAANKRRSMNTFQFLKDRFPGISIHSSSFDQGKRSKTSLHVAKRAIDVNIKGRTRAERKRKTAELLTFLRDQGHLDKFEEVGVLPGDWGLHLGRKTNPNVNTRFFFENARDARGRMGIRMASGVNGLLAGLGGARIVKTAEPKPSTKQVDSTEPPPKGVADSPLSLQLKGQLQFTNKQIGQRQVAQAINPTASGANKLKELEKQQKSLGIAIGQEQIKQATQEKAPKKKSLFSKYISIEKGIAKGILANTIRLGPKAVGLMLKGAAKKVDFFGDVDSIPIQASMPILFAVKGLRKIGAPKQLTAAGNKLIGVSKKILQQRLFQYTPTDKWEKLAYDFGGAGTSMAAALGVSYLTKSPNAASVYFGSMAESDMFERLTKKGTGFKKAFALSTTRGLVEGGLEHLGIKYVMRGYGAFIKNLFIRSASEGLQEGSQDLSGIVLDKVAGLNDQDLWEVAKTVGYSALLGAMTGGVASAALDTDLDGGREVLEAKGITDKATQDKVLKAIKAKVVQATPAIVDQISTQEANKLEQTGDLAIPNQVEEEVAQVEEADTEENLREVAQRLKVGEGGFVSLPEGKAVSNFFKRYFTAAGAIDPKIDQLNRQRAQLQISKMHDIGITAKPVRTYLNKLGSTQKKSTIEIVDKFLKGETTIEMVPEEIQSQVIKMRKDFDSVSTLMSAELQRQADKLPENQRTRLDNLTRIIDEGKGRYIPRYYEKHQRKDYKPTKEAIENFKKVERQRNQEVSRDVQSNLEAKTAEGRGIKRLTKTAEKAQAKADLPDAQLELMAEEIVKAKKYQGNSVSQFDKQAIDQSHFKRRKDIPKHVRELMGEIKDPVYVYTKGLSDMLTMAYNTEYMNILSDIKGISSDFKTAQHTELLPDSPAWGALRNTWINQELYDFIKPLVNPSSRNELYKWINKLMIYPFKTTKTVLNLSSHPRNLMGNTIFSMFADNSVLNPLNWKYYKDALDMIAKRNGSRSKEWQELIKQGVTGVQYFGTEVERLISDYKKAEPTEWSTITDKITKYPKKLLDLAGDAYNFEDEIYRVSAYLKYTKGKRMTSEQAAAQLDKYFTNYDRLPKVVEFLKDFPLFGPFVSFKANVLKITLNYSKETFTDLKRGNPAKLAKLTFAMMLPEIIKGISQQMYDIDDEEVKKLEKYLPSYRRGAGLVYYREGGKKDGRVKAFDLSYIHPIGDYKKAVNALINGDQEAFEDSLNLLQSPLFDSIIIWQTGRHPFYDTKIDLPGDTLLTKRRKRAEEILKNIYISPTSPIPSLKGLERGKFEPGLLTGYQAKKIFDAKHKIETKYGVRDMPEEIKNMLTGVNTFHVNPQVIMDNYINAQQWLLDDEDRKFSSDMRRLDQAPDFKKEAREKEYINNSERILKSLKEAEEDQTKMPGLLREEDAKKRTKRDRQRKRRVRRIERKVNKLKKRR